MSKKNIETKTFEELHKAKENVAWCLKNSGGLVDMHGLVYWAEEVERLRKKVKEEGYL